MFARLLLNLPALPGLYDYEIPPDYRDQVQPGSLVIVPFRQRRVQGVVMELLEQPAVAETRPIAEVVEAEAVLTAEQRALLLWMAEEFLYPPSSYLPLMLPPGLTQYADSEWGLNTERLANWKGGFTPVAQRLIDLLRARGRLRGRQIDRHFRRVDWRAVAEKLRQQGVLSRRSVLTPRRARPKLVRTAFLVAAPEAVEAALPHLARREAVRQRRAAVLQLLRREAEPLNLSWIYAETGCNLQDLQALAEQGLIAFGEQEVWRDPLGALRPADELITEVTTLTAEQEAAWAEIGRALYRAVQGETVRPLLLHGVTASGKTELYLRAVAEVLRQGRQAIVLVPEIALTPQTVRRFQHRFPGQVGLVHSALSDGERYDTWRRVRAGQLQVVIGPRSALFLPLAKIGLIVVDECHDTSYYQSEPPFYHAVEVAQHYARLGNAVCLLGSATPSVVQRYQAEIGRFTYLHLSQRIHAAESGAMPPVQVVDMRRELKEGVKSIFSRALSESLAEVLERGEQAILFLNRRGMATYVFCRQCGHVLRCPNCDLPLTLHLDAGERLLCHQCGYARRQPRTCPECGSTALRAYGLGVERVVAELEQLFPQARLLRWDRDVVTQRGAHDRILTQFAAHRADILVGTQMLAKGLDLPLVTLVGIVLADVGLNLPDPFAAERLFQVLTQVAGRAGRSLRRGRVILQTYMPAHYVIRHVVGHDVAGFYERELGERRRLGYPPFNELVRLEIRSPQADQAEDGARQLLETLALRVREQQLAVTLSGALPCFFSRLGGEYRWQILLRGPQSRALLQMLSIPRLLEKGWRIETHPVSLL